MRLFPGAELELKSRKPKEALTASSHRCGKDEHRCVNGMCILSKWICDSLDDCGDYSDEIECPNRSGCPADRFDCGNGQCVSKAFVCDKAPDCLNAADEAHCPSSSPSAANEESNAISYCRPDQFRCDNRQCINQSLVCNHETDCMDRSDERDCVYCIDDQFACISKDSNRTVKCIERRYVCDDVEDCDDGDDESERRCLTASRQQEQGISGKGVQGKHNTKVNDVSSNNHSHKSLTQSLFTSSHSPHYTQSPPSPLPLSSSRTKGAADHDDDEEREKGRNDSSFTALPSTMVFKMNDAGSRESGHHKDANAVSGMEEQKDNRHHDSDADRCHPSQYRCANGQCIPYNYRCDYQFHCRDGTDEDNCPKPVVQPFPYTVVPYLPVVVTLHSKKYEEQERGKKGVDLKVYDTPQTQKMGDDVVFRCRDEGETRFPVKWSRADGRAVSKKSRDEDGRLTLYHVSPADSGLYVCSAVGSEPEVKVTATLSVIQKERPEEWRRAKVTDDCVDEGDVCEGYQQLLKLVDETKISTSNPLYKMCHEKQHSYEYRK